MLSTYSSVDPAFLSDEPRVAVVLRASGLSATAAVEKAALFRRAVEAVAPKQGARVYAVFAPGRIEVLGKHTDYCGGRSLLAAVDRGLCIVAAEREESTIELLDTESTDAANFAMDAQTLARPGHWSNYGITVARRLARNFGAGRGARIALASDLPRAAGLSSSSALVTGLTVAVALVNRLADHPAWRAHFQRLEDLAGYCGCIENGSSFGELSGDRGVGTFGGSQDHTAILCCRPGMLSLYSFAPIRHHRDIALPPDLSFAVLPSGVTAEKTGAAMARYNEVSRRARALVELWNAHADQPAACLRDAAEAPGGLARLRGWVDALSDRAERDSLRLRLEQFAEESGILIPRAAEAIERGDWAEFGCLTSRSHELAVTHLQNQVPQTIELQRRAMAEGALAASAFGAGFGGAVWALCEGSALPGAWHTRPSCGLRVLSEA